MRIDGQRFLAGRLLWLVLLFVGGCGSGSEPAAVEIPVGSAVGQRAPAVEGFLSTGEDFLLEPSAAERTVLIFYRSAECGLCRRQLEQLQENLRAYERASARIVAVTLDPPEVSSRFVQRAGLEFPVVSVDSATFQQWDTLDQASQAPLPAAYVVESTGIVRYRHIGRNAADRTTDAELVVVLEMLSTG